MEELVERRKLLWVLRVVYDAAMAFAVRKNEQLLKAGVRVQDEDVIALVAKMQAISGVVSAASVESFFEGLDQLFDAGRVMPSELAGIFGGRLLRAAFQAAASEETAPERRTETPIAYIARPPGDTVFSFRPLSLGGDGHVELFEETVRLNALALPGADDTRFVAIDSVAIDWDRGHIERIEIVARLDPQDVLAGRDPLIASVVLLRDGEPIDEASVGQPLHTRGTRGEFVHRCLAAVAASGAARLKDRMPAQGSIINEILTTDYVPGEDYRVTHPVPSGLVSAQSVERILRDAAGIAQPLTFVHATRGFGVWEDGRGTFFIVDLWTMDYCIKRAARRAFGVALFPAEDRTVLTLRFADGEITIQHGLDGMVAGDLAVASAVGARRGGNMLDFSAAGPAPLSTDLAPSPAARETDWEWTADHADGELSSDRVVPLSFIGDACVTVQRLGTEGRPPEHLRDTHTAMREDDPRIECVCASMRERVRAGQECVSLPHSDTMAHARRQYADIGLPAKSSRCGFHYFLWDNDTLGVLLEQESGVGARRSVLGGGTALRASRVR